MISTTHVQFPHIYRLYSYKFDVIKERVSMPFGIVACKSLVKSCKLFIYLVVMRTTTNFMVACESHLMSFNGDENDCDQLQNCDKEKLNKSDRH